MSFDVGLAVLRIGILALLYLFLIQVILVVSRDLRRPVRPPASPQAGTSPAARLVVQEPGKSNLAVGEAFTLAAVTSLGRGAASAIRLTDDFVSTEHALISYRDRQWWIEDLGSTNGTFVNQRHVERPTILSNGDIVEIGSVHLRLERGGQPA